MDVLDEEIIGGSISLHLGFSFCGEASKRSGSVAE